MGRTADGIDKRGGPPGRARTARRALVPLFAAALLGGAVVALQPDGGGDPQEISAGGSAAASRTGVVAAAPSVGANRTIATSLSAGNGRTRIERSLPCDGSRGDSGYWHLQGETALPGGVLTAAPEPGDARLFADVHSPHHTIRVSPEPVAAPGPTSAAAYLPADSSRVSLSNARGSVKLGLVGGSCPQGQTPTMPFSFDGANVNGTGTWSVISASGSYRQAVGTGTYALQSGVLPGADNPWKVDVAGTLAVLQPDLDVTLADVYWGHDGVDYALRQVAAVYRVENTGAGDTYNAALTAASSPTPGASLIRILINGHNLLLDGNTPTGGGFPRSIGDLAAGEVTEVTVVWQLPLPAGNPPCKLVILGCSIATSLTFSAPDALDLPTTHTAAIPVKAPNAPPPL